MPVFMFISSICFFKESYLFYHIHLMSVLAVVKSSTQKRTKLYSFTFTKVKVNFLNLFWFCSSVFCIDLEVHQSSSCSCVVNIMHLCVITFIYLLSWDLFASLLIRNFHNSFAVFSSKILIFIERSSASHFELLSCVFIEFILSIGIY